MIPLSSIIPPHLLLRLGQQNRHVVVIPIRLHLDLGVQRARGVVDGGHVAGAFGWGFGGEGAHFVDVLCGALDAGDFGVGVGVVVEVGVGVEVK